MRTFIFLLTFVCAIFRLDAYTVAELIELSLLNSPETAAVAQQTIRAEGNLGVTLSDRYPKLSLAGSINHGRDYSFINGPLTNYTLMRGELILDYLLFNFGKLDHSINAARALVASSFYSHDFSIQQVMIKTLRAYFQAIRTTVNLDAERETLRQTEELIKGTEELIKAGTRGKTDLLALQVRKNDSLMRVKEKEADYLTALAHINILIGKPLNSPVELAPLDNVPAALPLLETCKTLRSDLQAKYKAAEAKREQWKATKSAALPTIKLSARSGAEKYVKSKSKGYDYDVAVRLSYPIFDGYENCYRQQQEAADFSTELWRIVDLENQIDEEIATLQLKLEAAWDVFQIADHGEKTTEEMYKSSVELYRAGKYSIFDVLNAQLTYQANMCRNELAKIDYFRALNELAYALGNLENLWEN